MYSSSNLQLKKRKQANRCKRIIVLLNLRSKVSLKRESIES